MSKKPFKSISISSLEVGMHITKLDISWIDSPFYKHSRLIKTAKEIEQLKNSGVKQVEIDPNRGKDVELKKADKEPAETPKVTEEEVAANTPDPTETSPKPETRSSQQKGAFLQQEIARAKEIHKQVRAAINSTLDALSAGNAFNKEKLTPIINQTLESLERHNQALLNLAHVSRRTQKMADHAFSTFCIALNLAQQQKCPREEIEALGIAALVHEAGWAHIPLQLMGKRNPYTESEKILIQKHAYLGVRALDRCEVSNLTRRIVAEHHEQCDGKGYPNKLSSNELHPLSRLFSVVDRYDELVHQLTDKPGMLPTNALRVLYAQAQKNIYDPQAVAQLISILGVYPISSAVHLSNGALGLVREVPRKNPLLPLVEIHVDESGKVLDTPIFIDLADNDVSDKTLTIDSIIDPLNATDPNHKRLLLNA